MGINDPNKESISKGLKKKKEKRKKKYHDFEVEAMSW
jgi:hypothetical protein